MICQYCHREVKKPFAYHEKGDCEEAGQITKHEIAIRLAFERGYRVTDDGRLLSPTGKRLPVRLSGKQRYPTFSVRVPAEVSPSRVFGINTHKFAAFCFYGERVFASGLVVRHIRDVTDISRESILLGTHSDNNLDKPADVRSAAARKARAAQGRRPVNAKLDAAARADIFATYRRGKKGLIKLLSDRHHVSKSTIWNVLSGTCYADERTN